MQRAIAVIILGIIFGVTLSKKVDRPNMIFGLVATLLVAFYFQLKIPVPWLLFVTTLFCFVDEICHEKVSKERFSGFFRYRVFLKMVIILILHI